MKFGYSQHKPEPNLNSIRVQMSESEADLTKQAQPKCHFWSDPAIPVWVWPNSRGNQRLYIFLVTLDSWAAEVMNSLPLRLQMSCCWHMFLYICEVVYHNYHRYRELILQENKKKEKAKKEKEKALFYPAIWPSTNHDRHSSIIGKLRDLIHACVPTKGTVASWSPLQKY